MKEHFNGYEKGRERSRKVGKKEVTRVGTMVKPAETPPRSLTTQALSLPALRLIASVARHRRPSARRRRRLRRLWRLRQVPCGRWRWRGHQSEARMLQEVGPEVKAREARGPVVGLASALIRG